MENEHIDDKLETLLRHEPDYIDGTDFCDDVQMLNFEFAYHKIHYDTYTVTRVI